MMFPNPRPSVSKKIEVVHDHVEGPRRKSIVLDGGLLRLTAHGPYRSSGGGRGGTGAVFSFFGIKMGYGPGRTVAGSNVSTPPLLFFWDLTVIQIVLPRHPWSSKPPRDYLSSMAAAVDTRPVHEDGAALEAIVDAIDTVNTFKVTAATEGSSFDDQSRFDSEKDREAFRQYDDACQRVKRFYAEHHAKQTVAHNLAARKRFYSPSRRRPEMSIWEAMERLNTLIDDSDPDTELSQIQHLLQCAEAIRRDGKPRWMQVTGLVHDLGKLMLSFDDCCEGQWDVVGDTFPVGCRREACIYPAMFNANPDSSHAVYSTQYGIYGPACGMDKLLMSWGHDEYLYLVLRDQSTLPREALAMIRFHSFYPWHHEGAYREFMAEGDEVLLHAVRAFNPYDLYSKSDDVPRVDELKVRYEGIVWT